MTASGNITIGMRVYHRSFPADPAGTVQSLDTVGGVACAIVKWDEGGSVTATPIDALVNDEPSGFVA